MRIENYITTVYNELIINDDYIEFYSNFGEKQLISIFSTLHASVLEEFRAMNQRLPTGDESEYFWAPNSRNLLSTIERVSELKRNLKDSVYAFIIEDGYLKLFEECMKFLQQYGGSQIPAHMSKIELYYRTPIFVKADMINIKTKQDNTNSYELKYHGQGSYADVYRYKDEFYDKRFILKRAKKNLNKKELRRFKAEFDIMMKLKSPYVVEVYSYNSDKNEYIMEFMDCTLREYIAKHNGDLTTGNRVVIVRKILACFKYIHARRLLHRDISPNNILLKRYEGGLDIKIADFGLVKIPESEETSFNTELKGSMNDPGLVLDGFANYEAYHETYALTRLIYFVMTGKTKINIERISNTNLKRFIIQGINNNKSKRYQNLKDLESAFEHMINNYND